ncbi:MAG TPA: hypothetical protein VNW46_15430 [Gemmatimonadaceae bacterium]|nr:hypothetical protein [Gemmatimonadaceae bacterium]
MSRLALTLLALSAVAIACSSGASGAKPATAATPAQSSGQSVLTGEEIAASKYPTAYDVVERLRRPWLRKDPTTGADVAVYMDEQNIGGADKLRDLPAVTVAEMDFLLNAAAIRRYGSSVTGSVIIVTRK